MPVSPRALKPAAALLCLFLLSTGCSEPDGQPPAKGAAGGAGAIPGTVQVKRPISWESGRPGGTWYGSYQEDPKSYNPFSNLDGTHAAVTGMILDYLFDYDPDTREWTGNLVDKFSVTVDKARDAMELACTLKSDVFWSDGVQMTADDMVWWYDEIEGDPEIYPVGAQGQFVRMNDGSSKRIELRKIDKLGFKYIFPRIVQNPVLMVNTDNIIPKHVWEPVKKKGKKAVMDFWGIDTPPEKLVGNGPFLLERNAPGERLIFKRNPSYWQKDEQGAHLPYLEKIVLTLTPDTNAELLKFQKGEVEAYTLRGKDLTTLLPEAEKKGYQVWNGGTANGYPALIFNQNPKALTPAKLGWFNDPAFRRAVSCLIDRTTIIDQVVNGLAEPCYHIIADFNRYYNPERATPYSYDPARAKEILAQAGYKDSNGDGWLEDAQGAAVSFDIITGSPDTYIHDIINIIISDMKKAGIKANLSVVDFNVVAQKLLNTWDWDCYFASFNFPTFPEQWYNIWRSDGNLHYWHPKQEKPAAEWERKVDELYQKLIHTYDDAEVRTLYDQFQKILMDELVIIPMYRRYSFAAVYSKWGNVNWDVRHSMGDGLRRVYLKN